MALNLFPILCFLTLMLVTSYANLSPEQYWKSQLPNIEIPQFIRDMLIQPVHTGRNGKPAYVGVKPVSDHHDIDAKLYIYLKADDQHFDAKLYNYLKADGHDFDAKLYNYLKADGHDFDAKLYNYLKADGHGFDAKLYAYLKADDHDIDAKLYNYLKADGHDFDAKLYNYLKADGHDFDAKLYAYLKGDGHDFDAKLYSYLKANDQHFDAKLYAYLKADHDHFDVSAYHYHEAASSDPLTIHDDPNLARRFFLEKDLQKGTTMTLHFTKNTNPGSFFPRMVAGTIPFSSKNLPEILNRFSIKSGSAEAEVMKTQIEVCEEAGLQGEEKYCATSLENMVDYAKSKLGKDVKIISTKVMNKETDIIQKYQVDEGVVKVNGEESTYVMCHKMNYAYAVFYCHAMKNTNTFAVPLKGEDGTKVKAVAICHTDTSQWNPNHYALKVLGVKPGTAPVCHLLPQDNIVWYNN